MTEPADDFLSSGTPSLSGRTAPANATILVVEDEAIVREGLAARALREGCHVLEAATIATALDQLGDTVDVMLPARELAGGDGLALVQKARNEHPDIPVVMMSATVTVEQVISVVKRGAFHYVSKGAGLDDLVLHVRKALAASRFEPADLVLPLEPHEQPQFQLPREGVKLDEVERPLLLQALERTLGNQARAGELLGINRDQVRSRLWKFGIGRRRARRARAIAVA